MNRIVMSLLVASAAVIASCSGGGSGGGAVTPGPGGSGTLDASFTPLQAAPGADSVAMDEGTASGDVVTVEIDVSDTNGVYGVAFDVVYDSANASFVNWTPGALLEQGGHSPTYQVSALTNRVVVAASRQGNVGGADASGSVPVIRLQFRVENPGSFQVAFSAESLFDDQVPPQEKPGIDWFGGTLVGN